MGPSVAISAMCMIFAVVALTGWSIDKDAMKDTAWAVRKEIYTQTIGGTETKVERHFYHGLRFTTGTEKVFTMDDAIAFQGSDDLIGNGKRLELTGAMGSSTKTTYLTCDDLCKDKVWKQAGNARKDKDCKEECGREAGYLHARNFGFASAVLAVISFFALFMLSILRYAFGSWNTIQAKIAAIAIGASLWLVTLAGWANFTAKVLAYSDRLTEMEDDHKKSVEAANGTVSDPEFSFGISTGCIMMILCWLFSAVPLALHAVWPHEKPLPPQERASKNPITNVIQSLAAKV